jgi:hypothetical protein
MTKRPSKSDYITVVRRRYEADDEVQVSSKKPKVYIGESGAWVEIYVFVRDGEVS